MLFVSNNKQIIGVLRFLCQFTMDCNRTSTSVVVNPYAKHPAAATTERSEKTNNVAITTVVTDLKMGNQSQLRNGAIKKCKKMATKRKTKRRVYTHNAIGGGVAFVAKLHCVVCKAIRLVAQGKNVSIPHRSHDKRCSNNRKTRGLSAMAVSITKATAENIAINNFVLGRKLAAEAAKKAATTNIGHFFSPYPQLNPPARNVTRLVPLGRDHVIAESTQQAKSSKKFEQKTPSIREVLDDTLASTNQDPNQDQELKWLEKTKYSRAMTLAIDHIVNRFEHRKSSKTEDPLPTTSNFLEAMARYHTYFPQKKCIHTFGPDASINDDDDSYRPSPHYHFIEGESFIYLDWKLQSPKVELCCWNCLQSGVPKADCWLRNDRTNFSKSKALFPVWTGSGRPMLAVVMNYRCELCSSNYMANDGRILKQLPAHLRGRYPVNMRYAQGTFHLHRDLTVDLEGLMQTYANASFVGKKMHEKLGLEYQWKLETYMSQFPEDSLPTLAHKPLSYHDFVRGLSPPSPAAIRALFSSAFYSPLTPYGYSQYNRNVREIQNVAIGKDDAIALDWTFQVVKNYNVPGAKAMFTANVGRTKEVFALALVASTSVSQVSHMLVNILEKRENFKPSVLYHDTCPHNQDFWRLLFGSNLEVRLGLFHLLHRIVDTLDSKCELYWKGLVSLKKNVYRYNDEDLEGLFTSLRQGTFSRDGKKYSSAQIDDLRHSKRWKQRCDPFLKKVILPGPIIADGIERWIVDFSDKTDSLGRPLFSRNTEKIAKEQTKKVKWVPDPPNMAMYREIPPGKRSTHQLSKWLSNRPESGLEKFHELLAHLANTGCGKVLADALTLGGTANHNVKARWKEQVNKKQLLGQEIHGTLDYSGEPEFYDHSYLDLLNRRGVSLGWGEMFDFIVLPREDNGEVFLSEYFEQQEKRNSTVGQDEKTKLCNCRHCQAYSPSELTEPRLPEEEQANDAVVEMSQQQQQQKEQHHTQKWYAVDSPAIPAPIVASLPPPFFSGHFGVLPSNCCFGWYPFYCAKKQEYFNRKYHGGGRRGRPPKCDFNCLGGV
jgi:hypothetical protein